MRKYLFFFLTLILNTIYLILPSKTYAHSLSLSLWPPLLQVMMQPGRSVTQVYKLTNNSEQELQITPQIYPFEPTGENGEIRIKHLTEENYLPSPNFFSFESPEKFGQAFPLPAKETKEMVLKVSLPSKSLEKDYYFTLLFSTGEVGEDSNQEGSLSTVGRIGSNILLTVSQLGEPSLLGKIVRFEAPLIVDSFSPANFTVVLENKGSNFWKPFGKIEVEGLFSQKGEVRLTEENVLAQSSRRLTLEPFQPKYPLGPFKARLVFTLNENGPELFSTVTFWYFPYRLILGLLGLFLLWKLWRLGKKKLRPAAP